MLVCLVVVGVVVYLYHQRTEHEAADRLLRETTANVDNVREAPPGLALVIDKPSGRSESANLPSGFPDEAMIERARDSDRPVQETVSRGGTTYTVRTEVRGDRIVQAVLDRSASHEEEERVLVSLLAAGLVGLVLTGLMALFLTRRTMAPLAKTVTMQRRFVADASHELRTPLTLLSTRVQLLARRLRADPGSERFHTDIEGVLADTRALTELLDDLLVTADTRALDLVPVELRSVCAECVDAVRAEAAENGGTVELRAGDPCDVLGAPASLRRAVLALVDNAVGHAAARVEVLVATQGRWTTVTVQDDGPGIPPDVLPHVFERFASDRPPTSGRRHYGLGLALVADIAARHTGSVSAGPGPDGAGASLTLRVPTHRGR